MSTEKQIKANRQNAQKSTGPKTDEGKAAVSQNAVKHGLFAQSVIKGENEADYEAFHDKMVAEMKPVGPTEILLAERIVSLWWRLERAERIQNQAIDVMIERDEPSPLSKRMHNWLPKDLQEIDYDTRGAGPELVLGRAIIKDYSYSRVLDRMILYERRIENSLHKTTRELERRQLIRQYQQQEAEQEFEPSMREKAATRNTTAEQNSDLKKQSQSTRSGFSVQSSARTNLKKQSQFVPAMIGITPFVKGFYGNGSAAGDDENKANQAYPEHVERSQSSAPALAEGAGKRKKSVSAATG